MKTMKYLLIIFLATFFLASCDDDGTDPFDIAVFPELENGGFVRFPDGERPALIELDGENNSFTDINVEDANGNVVSYTLDVRATLASMDSTYLLEDYVTVTSLPATIRIDAAEIAAGIGLPYDSLSLGDVFVFNGTAVTEDGRTYSGSIPTFDPETGEVGGGNTENQLLTNPASYNSALNFTLYAACPSDTEAFVGEYTSEIVASTFGGFVGSTNDNVTITFPGEEPFRYTISDISSRAYVPFGGGEYRGDFFDICGTPIPQTTTTFGTTIPDGESTYDPATGVITLRYFETNNNIGWTVVFTPR